MTTEINGLFAGNTATATNGTGTLAGTQQLTNLATSIANTVINTAGADSEKYGPAIVKSQSDMTELDKLINDTYNLSTVETAFLKTLTEEVLDGMLKSQQSKRSRCKSKEMTLDNYTSMMTAAIAEMLLRQAMGKEKGSFGGRSSGTTGYDADRLAKLTEDQDALRKEIRNVQSKKSIMKSKAGFAETDEKWLALLIAEEQLKSIRTDAPGATIKLVDPLRDELKELLAETNVESWSAKNLKILVNAIRDRVFSDVTAEEELAVDDITAESNEA